MFVSLKPIQERKLSADQIIGRLRGKLSQIPGATLYLQAVQDVRVGGGKPTRNINTRFKVMIWRRCLNGRRKYTANRELCPDWRT